MSRFSHVDKNCSPIPKKKKKDKKAWNKGKGKTKSRETNCVCLFDVIVLVFRIHHKFSSIYELTKILSNICFPFAGRRYSKGIA